jgi:AcrR family transcriptional regulator
VDPHGCSVLSKECLLTERQPDASRRDELIMPIVEQTDQEHLTTEEKIFLGTGSALSQYGLSKVSMNDISRAAGVSKATLYRRFPTKADVLKEFCIWEEKRFSENLARELEQADPSDHFDILVAHSSTLSQTHPAFMRLVDSDPAFVLSALRTLYPTVKAHLSALLAPIFGNILKHNDQDITVEQLTNCFVRVLLTTYLFPDESNDCTEADLKALFKQVCK